MCDKRYTPPPLLLNELEEGDMAKVDSVGIEVLYLEVALPPR